ncbi:hypothetical protein F2Q69_00060681 [Brassica cretica]|uniref:Peptidase C1A papain C-terminal domain-containing protein n=1 Tax=Brassica cretica TaxID=69181 RepID=A0A8S9RFT2_BRACR|nr:hypothetical protein F2Q69_00060681 [Brassica cretica]
MEDGGGDGSSGIGTGTVGGKHNKGKGVQNQTRLEADIRREQARKALQDGDPAEEFPFPQATPQDILTLLPTQGPIGISIDMDEKFSLLEDNGIHVVQEPKEGMKRHALIIVDHGRTKNNQLFFIVQNTWGTSWCNNGYARIIIEKTCPIFYVEALLA